MQVRDLIKELDRFEPTAEVRVKYHISGTFEGIPFSDEEYADTKAVEPEQAEPVIFCQ